MAKKITLVAINAKSGNVIPPAKVPVVKLLGHYPQLMAYIEKLAASDNVQKDIDQLLEDRDG